MAALFPNRRVGVLGTVNAAGKPRVAPVDILFVRGRFHASSKESSGRVKDAVYIWLEPQTLFAFGIR